MSPCASPLFPRCIGCPRCRTTLLVLWVGLITCCRLAAGFEVFAEQQILALNNPDLVVDYNNSEYGSTHVDDYFAKIDIAYSPLAGWTLNKYVRIGCFLVFWSEAPDEAWAEQVLNVTAAAAPEACTKFCNGTQAYLQNPSCRCALNESAIDLLESPTCIPMSWQIFRHFDYRSSMTASAYDVNRRYLYQLVTVRMMHVDPPLRNYIHALDVFENKPKFAFDSMLEQPIFNAVWDFIKSRLVALSWYPDEDPTLHFTVVSYNTSTGSLVVTEDHTDIQDQILAAGALVSQFVSVDGLSTCDYLYGTYYSVVPAQLPGYTQVVAIDINRRKVLNSATLEVTLMNMQINGLTHVLYGAGASLDGPLLYYQLCTAKNLTLQVGTVVLQTAKVDCNLTKLGDLPSQVNHMFLQSATIDHKYNYAWFMYKQATTANPLILEYHQTEADYIRWRPNSVPLEAAFTSLIQTVPRIVFTLYPPTLAYAIFNSAGTKIFVQFTGPTLQGAIPYSTNPGDDIPNAWNQSERIFRDTCDKFVDDFTMAMIPGTMCQWQSDSRFFIEIRMDSTILPGDLVRIRPNRIYAGSFSPGGVAQFSQPSTDFKPVDPPTFVPFPSADVSGPNLVDTCTVMILDGEGSKDYGFRGPFEWVINRTVPESAEPSMRQLQQVLRDQRDQDVYRNPHILRLPKNTLQANYTYYFTLRVTQLFNENYTATATHAVLVSALPVPPIAVLGASTQLQSINKPMTLSAFAGVTGCLVSYPGFQAPIIQYTWTGCLAENAVHRLFAGMDGCAEWEPAMLARGSISGIESKTLLLPAFTMEASKTYMFTVMVTMTSTTDPPVVLTNMASVKVQTSVAQLQSYSYGGNGFTAVKSQPFVVDISAVEQGCTDSTTSEAVCEGNNSTYDVACFVVDTGQPCPLGTGFPETTTTPPPIDFPDIGLGFDTTTVIPGGGGGGGVAGGRLLSDVQVLPCAGGGVATGRRALDAQVAARRGGAVVRGRRLSQGLLSIPCVPVTDPATNSPASFIFRGRTYLEAENVTDGLLSTAWKYCFEQPGVVVVQADALQVGQYRFEINVTKTFGGIVRVSSNNIIVQIVDAIPLDFDLVPQVTIELNSSLPVLASDVLRMTGSVANPRSGTLYTYTWTAYSFSANPLYDVDEAITNASYNVPQYTFVQMTPPFADLANPSQFRTPPGSRYMAVAPNTLSAAVKYRFRLEVMDTVLQLRGSTQPTGYAEFTFETAGLPTSVGVLTSNNFTGVAFETIFTLQMLGWGSEDIPLYYQFTFNWDTANSYSEPTRLTPAFMARNFIDTRLPAGAQAPDYPVQVTGYVMTSVGVTTASAPLELLVRPNSKPQVLLDLVNEVANTDSETALVLAIMMSEAITPSNPPNPLLNLALKSLEQKSFNASKVPNTPEILQLSAIFLTQVADRGLRTDDVVRDLSGLADRAVEGKFISVDRALKPGMADVSISMLTTTDAMTSGVVTQAAVAGGRRLALSDPLDPRTGAEQFSHLVSMLGVQRLLGTDVLANIFPTEVPAQFAMQGQDLYLGKDQTIDQGYRSSQGVVRETFDVPTLTYLATQFSREVYTYRYQIYKKFPYMFWQVPDRSSLTPPADDPGGNEERVPNQRYSNTEKLWYAMNLEIDDEAGTAIPAEINESLTDVTYGRLPKVAASGAQTLSQYATIDHAASCYYVDLGGGLPHFDSKGVTLDQVSCVAQKISSMVVFTDNLPKEIEVYEMFSRAAMLSILEARPATAAVSGLMVCVILGLAAGGLGIYVDEKQHNQMPIDLSKRRVVDRPEPTEKLFATLAYTFRRNHLIVGLTRKHRKLTREKRVWVLMVTGLATQSVATMLHANSYVRFRATTQFMATGLTAGVLIFPLTVFLQFLYEWRPMTRMHGVAPPRSAPPMAIDTHTEPKEIAQARSLFQPRKPLLLTKIRPPPKTAPPRVPLMSRLSLPVMQPGLPLDLPKLKVGDGSKKIAPPPRLLPQKPRPPKEPPPEEHLMVARSPTSMYGALSPYGGGLDPIGSVAKLSPFGLALPELPPLLQGSVTAVGKDVPPPPPKRSGAGPKPPQAPPPLSKMFFAGPQHASLRVPPLPPMKVAVRGPALPPLPKIMRPQDVLSNVKFGGDSARLRPPGSLPFPPPPPPAPLVPPKGASQAYPAPAPPDTPRDDTLTLTLPGSLATPRLPEPPSFRGASPEDIESRAPPQAIFSLDPEHAMMPPSNMQLRPGALPPPPPKLPGGAAAARPPSLPALPATPAPVSNNGTLALAPLPQFPATMPLPPPPPMNTGSQLAVASQGPTSMALALAPLRNTPGGGRLPSLPKNTPPGVAPAPLPKAILARIPLVAQETGNSLSLPPPPPPIGGFGHLALATMPVPPEEGEPQVLRGMAVYKAPPRRGGPTGRLPRPPPKPPAVSLQPTPPSGPPPAHAIVLARKAGVPGFDEAEIVKRARPPPPAPKPPQEAPPQSLQEPGFVNKQAVDEIAKQRKEASEDPFAAFRRDPRGQTLIAKRAHDEKAPTLVPDYIMTGSLYAVQLFIVLNILGFVALITIYGTYLPANAVYPTYAATIVGLVLNLGLFESVKCVVICCLAMVHDETEKRDSEIRARRARMELKAQRLQRGRRFTPMA